MSQNVERLEQSPGIDSPPSLQRLCIEFICNNLEKVCFKTRCPVEDCSEELSHDEADPDFDLNIALDQLHKKLEAQISPHEPKVHEKLHFVAEEGQLLFHTKLSEEFFQRLSDMGQITDLVLTLFDGQKTRVRKMCIENASKFYVKLNFHRCIYSVTFLTKSGQTMIE